jgi:propanol-preferring alcohol dehydrogenase
MKAMVLNQLLDLRINRNPLELAEMPEPTPDENEIVIKIKACGVCHTELDEIEGRTPPSLFPMILGHQVVGEVVALGTQVSKFSIGHRVGIAWIFSSCRKCDFCRNGMENLCDHFRATGRDAHGGYADFTKISEHFAFKVPEGFSDVEAAPLLCAGAIGYRSLRLANLKNGQRLGLTGFGASAHLVLKMAKHTLPDTPVYVFARSEKERAFAKGLGAVWAGDTSEKAPEKLDAIIDTTPAWKPIVEGLKNLEKNGRLVINAIRKEDIDKQYLMKLDYPKHLWLEKEIKSVANVAVCDVSEFLNLAAEIQLKPEVQVFPLESANLALMELKEKKIRGAKVLVPD